MEYHASEKIILCYTVAGPTYKKSALELLKNRIKHNNIKYSLITNDKRYFSEILDNDIIVKELKEFYQEYPEIEPYEYFLETENLKEYGDAFLEKDYSFPFSSMRFHLKIAESLGITNVGLLATDSTFEFELITDELLSKKNILYNAVSLWPPDELDLHKIEIIRNVVKELWNTDFETPNMIYDEAARFYVFESVDFMNKFFLMWHELIVQMFKNETIKHFRGTFMHNEELMLAIIYKMLHITHPDPYVGVFDVNHDLELERPWTVGAGLWSA